MNSLDGKMQLSGTIKVFLGEDEVFTQKLNITKNADVSNAYTHFGNLIMLHADSVGLNLLEIDLVEAFENEYWICPNTKREFYLEIL